MRALRACRRATAVRSRRSCRGSFVVGGALAKGRAVRTPLLEPRFVGRGESGLEVEQSADEQIVPGFEQAQAFGQLTDFDAAFVEQFGVFAGEADFDGVKRPLLIG